MLSPSQHVIGSSWCAASNGYPLDISMGLPGYEDEVMRRAALLEIAPDKSVYICSAEDLIIHKAIAGRPQDLRDIEGIVLRQQESSMSVTSDVVGSVRCAARQPRDARAVRASLAYLGPMSPELLREIGVLV